MTINGTGTLTLVELGRAERQRRGRPHDRRPGGPGHGADLDRQRRQPAHRGRRHQRQHRRATTGLTLAGTARVILTNANTYTGGTTVDAATTLQLGDGVSNNGSVTGNIADNGLLVFANPLAQTFTRHDQRHGQRGRQRLGRAHLHHRPQLHRRHDRRRQRHAATGRRLGANGSVTGNISDNGLLAFANPSASR